MKLITEQIEDVKVITEGKGDDKKLYIEGVFLQAELKNRNGRVYPFKVLENENWYSPPVNNPHFIHPNTPD